MFANQTNNTMQDGTIHFNESLFNSSLSFKPLVNALKKKLGCRKYRDEEIVWPGSGAI